MKVYTSPKGGFTLVEIMIVVAIIGMLAAIAIPNFVRARSFSQKNACVANLKQIDGAKTMWALEEKKGVTETPTSTDIYGTDRYIRSEPTCPGGGTYSIESVQTKPTCTLGAADEHVLP